MFDFRSLKSIFVSRGSNSSSSQIMASSALVGVEKDAEDAGLEVEYGKLKCDPSISVADLEKALGSFFFAVGYSNFQEVLDVINDGKVTWKSAAKAPKVPDVSIARRRRG